MNHQNYTMTIVRPASMTVLDQPSAIRSIAIDLNASLRPYRSVYHTPFAHTTNEYFQQQDCPKTHHIDNDH
jgi:hypothetical protein